MKSAPVATAHMDPMATLDTFFVLRRQVKHRVTLLEDSYDVHIFSRITDCYPGPDGTFRRDRKDYTRDDIPLLGSYFVEELDEDGDRTGRFEVLTPEEFAEKLSEHREPQRQYGIQWIPDPAQVVQHPHPERCREVMDCLPQLKLSGEYRVVTRLAATEPGPWEPLEEVQ